MAATLFLKPKNVPLLLLWLYQNVIMTFAVAVLEAGITLSRMF